MKINIYIPDSDHAKLQVAQASMRAAGTSLSAQILQLVKTTKFWPRDKRATVTVKKVTK